MNEKKKKIKNFLKSISIDKSKSEIIEAAEKIKTELDVDNYLFPIHIIENKMEDFSEISFLNLLSFATALVCLIVSCITLNTINPKFTEILMIISLIGIVVCFLFALAYLIHKFYSKNKTMRGLIYAKSILEIELEKEKK